jgi:hypothetical protein
VAPEDNWVKLPNAGWRLLRYFGSSGPRNAMIRARLQAADVPSARHMAATKAQPTGDRRDVELPVRTIAVLDLVSDSVTRPALAALQNAVVGSLAQTGRYNVIEPGQRDLVLREMQFSLSDAVDQSAGIEIGKLLFAHLLLSGQVTAVDDQLLVQLRITRVATGERVALVSMKYGTVGAAVDGADGIVAELFGRSQ